MTSSSRAVAAATSLCLVFSLTVLAALGSSLPAAAAGTSPNNASGWSPWKPYVNQPFSFRDCGTSIRVTFPVNQEQQRTRKDAGGNTIIEVKGPAQIRFTPAARSMHQATRDVSGPSLGALHQIAYRNGDFLFAGTGNQWTSFEFWSELPGTGLPLTFVSHGTFRILFKADRHGVLNQPADIITRPRSIENVCTLIQ